jgi:hypothetical protein
MSAADRLRELDAKATPGPWQEGANDRDNPVRGRWIRAVMRDGHFVIITGGTASFGMKFAEDAAVVVALRNALPALADVLDAADELRVYPAHPDFLFKHAERCAAYDAALARLTEVLK